MEYSINRLLVPIPSKIPSYQTLQYLEIGIVQKTPKTGQIGSHSSNV